MKKAAIITLGCRLNQADAALMVDRLEKNGYNITEVGDDDLDLIIVNSCAVTAAASAKSRQAAGKWRKKYPRAKIVAVGCAVEAEYDKWRANSECDAVLTNIDKKIIDNMLNDFDAPNFSLGLHEHSFSENATERFPFRHRSLVKIQEGCNNFCSYCIVPYVRGPERSRAVGEVLESCRKLIESKVPEIVLTGVNTCKYYDSGYDLGKLVRTICAEPGDFRIRLSSTEPDFKNIKLLESLAQCKDKVCRFLHLSLQHGSNRILKAMRRSYSVEEYADFVRIAREIWPLLHVGSDVIVGFPGEDESAFKESIEFIESMEFANIHQFTFSPRPGTPAADFPHRVAPQVAKARFEQLKSIAARSAAKFQKMNHKQPLPVIFEEEKNGQLHGWSDNYLPVQRPVGSVRTGEIVEVEFFDAQGETELS